MYYEKNEGIKLNEVVIASACRTPIGKFGGALQKFTAAELGALVIKEALARAGVEPEKVDYVFMGQVLTAGCGQVPSRQASIKAGIPSLTPSITINKVCSSGIKAIDLAVQMIQIGRADICVAGGMESMSSVPYGLPDMRWGVKMGVPSRDVIDLMIVDGLWCSFYDRHMAVHGSVVSREFGVTREEQDEWAFYSQTMANRAIANGALKDEIKPVELNRNGNKSKTVIFDTDEGPRADTTLEALAKLPPIFDPEGTVTAGNAPGLNDGAGAAVLMTREKAVQLGIKPLCEILGYAEVSQDPKYIATVPGLSIKKLLNRTGYSLKDMKLIEINEAFAAVAMVSGKIILGMSDTDMRSRVNVNGGAIAFGHPIGATGARIAMTMAYELRRRGGGIGICGICSGAAQGDAMLIKVD
jgi:acetyl-CoA C-acetyltransferase